jgi:hypothetical protein
MPIGLPVLTTALFLPMALGLVGPNTVYGYRTAKSLSSPELWRAANQSAGWLGVAFSVAALLVNIHLLRSSRLQPEHRRIATLGVFVVAMLACTGLQFALNG